MLERRSGQFNTEQAATSDSGSPEEAYVPQHSPYAYEGSSSGVPRYPPQKRRYPSQKIADLDVNGDDHVMHKNDGGRSLDEPLDPELAAALKACEENDNFDDV